MIFVIGAIVGGVAFVAFCCVIVGGRADKN